jgi:hypothetical protein
MYQAGQVAERIKLNPSEQTQNSQTTSSNTPDIFAKVWRGLQAARHISKDDGVGETDYKYWNHMLKDLTNEKLLAGLKAVDGFQGYMTIGVFKKLCLDASVKVPAYRPFNSSRALTVKPIQGDVLQSRLRSMKAELGL